MQNLVKNGTMVHFDSPLKLSLSKPFIMCFKYLYLISSFNLSEIPTIKFTGRASAH